MSIIVNEVVTDVSLNVTEIISTFTIQINEGGVPVGGTTGQVLAKKTNADYDTEWVAQSGGGSTPDATTLIKGKLKLAGDLGGTADLPTVPSLASKGDMFKSENLSGLTDYVAARRNLDVYDEMVSFYSTDFLTGLTLGATSPFAPTALLSGTLTAVGGEINHPGIISINSIATINSGGIVRIFESGIILKGGEKSVNIFRPKTNTDAFIRGGFTDSVSHVAPVDGVYYEITNGDVVFKTMRNSVGTTSSTIATLTVNNWYKFEVLVISTSLATLNIYDESGALLFTNNITTNIPTGVGRATGEAFSATRSTATAGAIVELDYIDVTLNGLVR